MSDHERLPGPQAAYAQWLGACAEAGWAGGPQAEEVPVTEALGRVTAAPVRARWPVPLADCAAMDGIAVSATDVAGQDDRELPAGSFAWVDTGDRVPAGRDTVVPREQITLRKDGSVQVRGLVRLGQHVRASGEDFAQNRLLVPAGHRLRPADLAAATACGHAAMIATRRPVVAIIPTGNEILPPGKVPGPGQAIDSNSVMLAARALEAGARPVVAAIQRDDAAAIIAQVRALAAQADVVLVIAGSSAGRRDHTADVLAKAGGLVVRGVAVRPGHPVLLGYAGGLPGRVVPVIGVPGYPLAAAVIFELFAMPLLANLEGLRPRDDRRLRVQLACDWTSSADVEDWVPVSLSPAASAAPPGGLLMATPSRRGASSISRLVSADAWWPIPIGQASFEVGQHIYVQPLLGAP